ncbi:MAG: hypothetical protein Gaeavirus13_8 [Gaeavirus sp.]|uniref:Uncharacterized protein n=1 Tax=Gaeavirus sp. TaxID=2487767 RepID=A0A3G4ZYZ3_9VIRU|nr:MAG: hypothetical protein Gaeavirus13_8 [Gaeavirus sp.]
MSQPITNYDKPRKHKINKETINYEIQDTVRRCISPLSTPEDIISSLQTIINYANECNVYDKEKDAVHVRMTFIQYLSWSIPSVCAISTIKKAVRYKSTKDNTIKSYKILSIGSGNGFWEFLLHKSGLQIIASDIKQSKTPYYDVEHLSGYDAVRKYSNYNVLFINWPSDKNKWAFTALDIFKGNIVIYIGDMHADCAADDDFYERIWTDFTIQHIELDSWRPLRDGLYICKRKIPITRSSPISI